MSSSSEFKLAVDCCASSFRGREAVALRIGPDVDWRRFLQLARFHRIEGLARNSLVSNGFSLPGEVESELSEAALTVAARNLRMGADCLRLLSNFQNAGVPLLFLKGLPVAALAYANPALKSAIDIDLLIDPADLKDAADLLRGAGYELVAPRPSPHDRALMSWHRHWKESVWAKRDLRIDLHTRTADNPRLIRGIDVHSPQQTVQIREGLDLPTLADEELFAYLAVHGASSAWFRLKWVSDFAALLHDKRPQHLEYLYRRSQDLGAGRAAGQALLLAHELFGTLNDCDALTEELRRDPGVRSLYRTALELVTGEPIEPTERWLGTFPLRRSQFWLLPGMAFRLSELSGQTARILTRVR